MLARILAKLTPEEQEWLLLQIGKRPAHRPKTPARVDKRADIWWHIQTALREGKQVKMAIHEAMKKWDISEATVRRRYTVEARRQAKLSASVRKWRESRAQKGLVVSVTRRLPDR